MRTGLPEDAGAASDGVPFDRRACSSRESRAHRDLHFLTRYPFHAAELWPVERNEPEPITQILARRDCGLPHEHASKGFEEQSRFPCTLDLIGNQALAGHHSKFVSARFIENDRLR